MGLCLRGTDVGEVPVTSPCVIYYPSSLRPTTAVNCIPLSPARIGGVSIRSLQPFLRIRPVQAFLFLEIQVRGFHLQQSQRSSQLRTLQSASR